jgi:hypothetical protein
MNNGIINLPPITSKHGGPGARQIIIEGEPIGYEQPEPFHGQNTFFSARETFGKKRARTQISPQWLQKAFHWTPQDRKALLAWATKQDSIASQQSNLWNSRSALSAATKAAKSAYQSDPSPGNLKNLAKAKSEEAGNELTFDDRDDSLRSTREAFGRTIISDAILINEDMSAFVLQTAQEVEQAEQATYETFLATYVPSELVRALLDLSDDILKHAAKLDEERSFGHRAFARDHLFVGNIFPEEGK